MMVNPHHAKIVDTFLKDLKEVVKEIKEHPEASSDGDAAIYGMVASLPDRKKVKDYITIFTKIKICLTSFLLILQTILLHFHPSC